jgi:hypothetical protein
MTLHALAHAIDHYGIDTDAFDPAETRPDRAKEEP